MLFKMEGASLLLLPVFGLSVRYIWAEKEIVVILLRLLLARTEKPQMLPLSVDLHFK